MSYTWRAVSPLGEGGVLILAQRAATARIFIAIAATAISTMLVLTHRPAHAAEIVCAQSWRAEANEAYVSDWFPSEDKTALRSVINSGHTRGQGVVRCVEPDHTPQLFKTFGPKAIGMVGRKLPATTLGRCIIVELRRRKNSEPVERFAHKDDAELEESRRRLLRWSTDNEDALQDAEPSMPDAFDNRRADNWRVMFAVADLAGEDWGEKARFAAAKLEGASDTSSIGVDYRQAYAELRHAAGDARLNSLLRDINPPCVKGIGK